MAHRRVVLASDHGADGARLREAFARIRQELGVPGDFPDEVLQEARAAAAHRPGRGVITPGRFPDETDVPYVTIDPPGSLDLDQALYLERDGAGYRVLYAIAHVPAFVAPGGTIDAEARRRGETVYLPDGTAPLHPRELSEGATSLLPGRIRPAFVWDMRLDGDGRVGEARVRQAIVRSVARLDYLGTQRDVDAGVGAAAPDGPLELLSEIGQRRIALERERGGASLPRPEQEVVQIGDEERARRYRLRFRPPVPVEDWNAQISLMTGMAAADMMLEGGVGVLRTMPPPRPEDVERFRRRAAALGVMWSPDVAYGEFLRSLDRADPRDLALLHAATALFRGAGYTPFDGAAPEKTLHAALAAPYAHVTAPLRRLVDRFGLVICAALCAGRDVPGWAREALASLPDIMRDSGRLTSAVTRACTDAVEAAVLEPLVGEEFEATVVDSREDSSTVQLEEPAVLARVRIPAQVGSRVGVRLVSTDLAARKVVFELVERVEPAGPFDQPGSGDLTMPGKPTRRSDG
ncbi:MAG: RNB domain-containing ribonuclease [Dermatophilaceae bacterium]